MPTQEKKEMPIALMLPMSDTDLKDFEAAVAKATFIPRLKHQQIGRYEDFNMIQVVVERPYHLFLLGRLTEQERNARANRQVINTLS